MLPVTSESECVRKHTQQDSTLVRVHEFGMNGWHESKDPTVAPFYCQRNRTPRSHYVGSNVVVILAKLRSEVLQTLHETHVGFVRMKALARMYV